MYYKCIVYSSNHLRAANGFNWMMFQWRSKVKCILDVKMVSYYFLTLSESLTWEIQYWSMTLRIFVFSKSVILNVEFKGQCFRHVGFYVILDTADCCSANLSFI